MRTLGRYEILEELGRGGFAVVYKARDPDLDRVVALKVLAPHLTWDPTFAERFRQEAQATARLRHPNIVVIHEVGEDDQQLYIAMEYLPGRTLAETLDEEGAIPVERALPILQQVASSLDYAHGQGLIHRDVKPSNVFLETDAQGAIHVTLMDFGLVKAMESSASLTSMGTILGSPEYMAPEQVDPERIDEIGPATDRYALGVVAYEMLVGQVPFPGSTPSTLFAHVQQTPPDPQSIYDDLPASVAEVLLKALSKTTEGRFPTARALVEALEVAAEPEPEPEPQPRLVLKLSVKPKTVEVDGKAAWTVIVLNEGDGEIRHVIARRGNTLLGEPFDLVAGGEQRFTFTTTYEAAGKRSEEVTVTGIANSGEWVDDKASAVVLVRQPPEPEPELHPGLAITLSVKPETVHTDEKATWTVTLRNDGDDPLRDVTLTRGGILIEEPFGLEADRGRRFSFTTVYETEGKKIEKVVATALSSSGKTVNARASSTVQVRRPPEPDRHPSLALKLSVKPKTVETGREAKWTVTLRNDGDDYLQDVTVTRGGTLLKEPFCLTIGTMQQFSFSTIYETEGRKTVKVAVTAISTSGKVVGGEASVVLQVRQPPEPPPEPHTRLTLKLSVKPQTVRIGGAAEWTVTLRNDGDDYLRDVTVKRDGIPIGDPFNLGAGTGAQLSFRTACETEGRKTVKVMATAISSSGRTVREQASATLHVREARNLATSSQLGREPLPGELILLDEESERIFWFSDHAARLIVTNRRLIFWDQQQEKHSRVIPIEDLRGADFQRGSWGDDMMITLQSGQKYDSMRLDEKQQQRVEDAIRRLTKE